MRNDQQAKEDQMMLASVRDKYMQAADNYMMTRTNFLDMRQRTLVQNAWREMGKGQKEIRLEFFGGYEDAERTVALFLPDYMEDAADDLCVIRAKAPAHGRRLTHRDYLGSLTGLGLKREMIGDILVREDGADIIILEEIKDFLMLNYDKAGRTTLQLEAAGLEELQIPEKRVQVVKDTVASLRLDNVVSSAFGLSRGKAAEAIRQGIVFVNSMQVEKIDAQVAEGDKLVLRGKGKAYLKEVGGRTRKDRLFIEIERYL